MIIKFLTCLNNNKNNLKNDIELKSKSKCGKKNFFFSKFKDFFGKHIVINIPFLFFIFS